MGSFRKIYIKHKLISYKDALTLSNSTLDSPTAECFGARNRLSILIGTKVRKCKRLSSAYELFAHTILRFPAFVLCLVLITAAEFLEIGLKYRVHGGVPLYILC